jgi:hypothetical protein
LVVVLNIILLLRYDEDDDEDLLAHLVIVTPRKRSDSTASINKLPLHDRTGIPYDRRSVSGEFISCLYFITSIYFSLDELSDMINDGLYSYEYELHHNKRR